MKDVHRRVSVHARLKADHDDVRAASFLPLLGTLGLYPSEPTAIVKETS